jgi:hypothetical protein
VLTYFGGRRCALWLFEVRVILLKEEAWRTKQWVLNLSIIYVSSHIPKQALFKRFSVSAVLFSLCTYFQDERELKINGNWKWLRR